jgi:hypothetical protein
MKMPKKVKSSTKTKTFGTIIVGVFLFSTVITMFIFPVIKPVYAEESPFIKVKEGDFEFLDSKGYNFRFNIDIQSVKIIETKQVIGNDKIVVESENVFGITQLIFDKLSNGNVKFTIDHQGNMERNYQFKLTILNEDIVSQESKNLFLWDSGYFDYSDMVTPNPSVFWLNRNTNNHFTLRMAFENTRNFWIDPLLSPQVSMDVPIVSEQANNTDQFTTAYQPLFADDSLTDSNSLANTNNPYWSPQSSPILEEFDYIDNDLIFDNGYHFPFNSTYTIGGSKFIGSVVRGDGNESGWVNVGSYFTESDISGLVFNITKVGSTGLDVSYNQIRIQQGEIFDNSGSNISFSNWYVRFKINKTSLAVDNTYLRIQPTEELNYTWQFNSETNDLNLTRAEILDNEWHEFCFMVTDISDFVEPYSAKMAYQVFFDQKLVLKTNASFLSVGIPRYSIELVVNGSSTSISQNANSQFLLDYMAVIPSLKYQLSNDSTTGSYSVESYSSVLNPSNNNLVGLWDFETGEGSTTYDLSGNNHDGVIHGASWNTTTFANDSFYSLDFEDSENDFINITDHDDFTFATAGVDESFSLSAWVKPEAFVSGHNIISKMYFGVASEWNLFVQASGKVTFRVMKFDNSAYLTCYNNSALTTGVWHHIVAIYNGNESVTGMSLYIDGEEAGFSRTTFGSYTGMINTDVNVTIGNSWGGGGAVDFDGLIDQVKIYDKELSQIEVINIYENDPITREECSETISYVSYRDVIDDYYINNDNLVGYWQFDSGEGSNIYDLSGNNHDGVIDGASWNTTTFANDSFYSLDFEEDENDNVTFIDHNDFSFGNGVTDSSFSISFWFNLENPSGSAEMVIGKVADLMSGTANEWYVTVAGTNGLGLTLYSEGGTSEKFTTSATGFSAQVDTWYYAIVTYNGNNSINGISLYINGSLWDNIARTDSGSYVAMNNYGHDVEMGFANIAGSRNIIFDGLIDQLKIFDKELTSSEIASMYANDPNTRIGMSSSIDYSSDYSKRYNTDNSSNYLEGEELLRLNFGNYYRRVDQYISSKDNWYSYASEGINLVNHPIMTFDMKVVIDVNVSQFNSFLSNAYITLYNESMYSISTSSWYDGYEYYSGNNYVYRQQDYGFIIINDSWVSIKIDLRQVVDIWSSYIDYYDTEAILSAVGGIGFGFYFQQNNTEISYSVKIDNLQFLPIQTVGSYDFYDLTDEKDTIYQDFGATNVWNYDNVKVGNRSLKITVDSDTIPLIWNIYLSSLVNQVFFNNYSMLFWLYPINTSLGFYQDNGMIQRMYMGDTNNKYHLPLSNILFMGEEDINYAQNSRNWLQGDTWHLIYIPLNVFNLGYDLTDSSSMNDVLKLFKFFLTQKDAEENAPIGINFLMDGLSFVPTTYWDYSNLTLPDYSTGWNQSYQVNSTINNQQQYSGLAENWEWTEPMSNTLNRTVWFGYNYY